jgi:hypothetical protein
VSRKRGRRTNRRLADALRKDALALVRERYSDFGPAFAHEKLTEVHRLEVSVSMLPTWMTDAQIWVPRLQRQRSVHQPRARRECYGELNRLVACERRSDPKGKPAHAVQARQGATSGRSRSRNAAARARRLVLSGCP